MTFSKIERNFKRKEREMRKEYRTYMKMTEDDLWNGRMGAYKRHLRLANEVKENYEKFINDLANVK